MPLFVFYSFTHRPSDRIHLYRPTLKLYLSVIRRGVALAVIAGSTRRDFHKSMTTYADFHVWQEVYHVMTPVREEAYIKITLRD